MRAVTYTGAGGNEVIKVGERPDPTPEGDEVLIAASFAGINNGDINQRDGLYPAPPGSPADIPGLEVAGEIVAVGPRVLGRKVGERVMGLVGGGGLADRVAVSERHVVLVPDRLSESEAAATPEAFITAHDAIRGQADLAPGEVLLVNGASGGVGSAAVQIGRAAGAIVVGTSRTEEGRRLITDLGGVATDPADVAETIAEASGGRGADVVLELVGAPNLATDQDVLAFWGRIVIIGVGAGAKAEINLRKLMGVRGRVLASTLRARPSEEKAAAVQAFGREMVPQLARGEVAPIVDRSFPAADIAAAFEHFEKAPKRGKVLLDFTQ